MPLPLHLAFPVALWCSAGTENLVLLVAVSVVPVSGGGEFHVPQPLLISDTFSTPHSRDTIVTALAGTGNPWGTIKVSIPSNYLLEYI